MIVRLSGDMVALNSSAGVEITPGPTIAGGALNFRSGRIGVGDLGERGGVGCSASEASPIGSRANCVQLPGHIQRQYKAHALGDLIDLSSHGASDTCEMFARPLFHSAISSRPLSLCARFWGGRPARRIRWRSQACVDPAYQTRLDPASASDTQDISHVPVSWGRHNTET